MPPVNESETLCDLAEGDLTRAVNYKSDTYFMGPNGCPLTILAYEDDYRRAPSPLSERDAVDTLAALRFLPDVVSTVTVTKLLKEQHPRFVDKERERKVQVKELGYTPRSNKVGRYITIRGRVS